MTKELYDVRKKQLEDIAESFERDNCPKTAKQIKKMLEFLPDLVNLSNEEDFARVAEALDCCYEYALNLYAMYTKSKEIKETGLSDKKCAESFIWFAERILYIHKMSSEVVQRLENELERVIQLQSTLEETSEEEEQEASKDDDQQAENFQIQRKILEDRRIYALSCFSRIRNVQPQEEEQSILAAMEAEVQNIKEYFQAQAQRYKFNEDVSFEQYKKSLYSSYYKKKDKKENDFFKSTAGMLAQIFGLIADPSSVTQDNSGKVFGGFVMSLVKGVMNLFKGIIGWCIGEKKTKKLFKQIDKQLDQMAKGFKSDDDRPPPSPPPSGGACPQSPFCDQGLLFDSSRTFALTDGEDEQESTVDDDGFDHQQSTRTRNSVVARL